MKQKKVELHGVKYTFQKVAPRQWLRIRQRSKDKNGNPVEENLYSEVLEHIVIEPKKTLDDFDEIEELEEVIKEAITFQQQRAETE